jgi:hypothetical protein
MLSTVEGWANSKSAFADRGLSSSDAAGFHFRTFSGIWFFSGVTTRAETEYSPIGTSRIFPEYCWKDLTGNSRSKG